MAEEKQDKKIIIDEDWKNQAQKEKEVLKDKEHQPQEHTEPRELPPGDLNAMISLLATQAMFAMGFIATEKGKEPQKNLPLAKFYIDMLEAIETKTKGNLTEQETKLLTDALSQLRMGFVSAAG